MKYSLFSRLFLKVVFLFLLLMVFKIDSTSAETIFLSEKNYEPKTVSYKVVGDNIELTFSNLNVDFYYVNVCNPFENKPKDYNCFLDGNYYSIVLPSKKKVTFPLKNIGSHSILLAVKELNGKTRTLAKLEVLMENPTYLSGSFISDKEHSYVKEVVNQLFPKETEFTDYEIMSKAHSYIVNNLSYDYQLQAEIDEYLFFYPNFDKLAHQRMGICYEIASFYTAILRSMGIPSKLEIGWVSRTDGTILFHAWTAVLDNGKWKIIDPTWDLYTKHFNFRLDKNYEVVYTY